MFKAFGDSINVAFEEPGMRLFFTNYFFRDFVHNPAPKGMEPLGDVVRRTGEFLEAVKAFSGNILISTQAIAMKGML